MVKVLLCLLFLVPFQERAEASEKAFTVLLNNGLSAEDLVVAVKKYPELIDLEVIAEETHVTDEDASSRFKFYADKTNDIYYVSKLESDFQIIKSVAKFDVEPKIIEGAIKNNLFDTVLDETGEEKIATAISDAFKDDFTTTKGLRAKARYEFVIEKLYENDQFVKFGNIISASLIIGKAIIKKTYQFDSENLVWTLLPENSQNPDKPFYSPVTSRRVTSLFQLNRRHPVTRRHQPHNGVDFGAPSGSPIYPALDGEVIAVARTRSKGKFVTIRHDNGYETTYIHMSRFQPGLKVGMRVELGDQIGEVGRTGYATGAHLHFGVLKDGYFVNPIYLLKSYCYNQKDQYEGLESDLIQDKDAANSDIIEDEIEE